MFHCRISKLFVLLLLCNLIEYIYCVYKTCRSYSTVNTNNGLSNYYTCMFYACPSTTVNIAGCYTSNGQVVGATGDQYLRLFDESGNQVAYNDDGNWNSNICSLSSYISYTIPTNVKCQTYSLNQGCYGSLSCSGQVVVFDLIDNLLALSYCLPGTYLSGSGDSCMKCPQNTYSSGYDDFCKNCPLNSWSSSGSSTCSCNKGFTQNGFGDSLSCSSCGSSYIYTSQTCPSNYIMQNPYSYFPKCYQYVNQYLSYGDALDYCNSHGGWLVTISNSAENELVKSLHPSTSIWIGLNDVLREGNYNWAYQYSGGMPFYLIPSTYTNWFSLEPNDCCNGEDCAVQWGPSAGTAWGYWNDAHCGDTTNNQFICESNMIDTCQDTSINTNKVPLKILCDNYCRVYINGLYVGYSASWSKSTILTPTINAMDIIAIEAIDAVENGENYAGFAVTLSYPTGEVYTSTQWKCSTVQTTTLPSGWNLNSFDDSSWSYASSYGATSSNTIWGTNDMQNQAQFIWSSDYYNHNHIICRYKNQVQTTKTPTALPSRQPTCSPTVLPSPLPTTSPTVSPSTGIVTVLLRILIIIITHIIKIPVPTAAPTASPTISPSTVPTAAPTLRPTVLPTSAPTKLPTSAPTVLPTFAPTTLPSSAPTTLPTSAPTCNPTIVPSPQPSFVVGNPTPSPTIHPSTSPSFSPSSYQPSCSPSPQPTTLPSYQPSTAPSLSPTIFPSRQPTYQPSTAPSLTPSQQPTRLPSYQPSTAPSLVPSPLPTSLPTYQPSYQPSTAPTPVPSQQPTPPKPTTFPTVELKVGLSTEWLVVYKTSGQRVTGSMGKAMDPIIFNSGIFYRSCSDCVYTHKNIYYKRVSPFPPEFSMYNSIIQTWSSSNNILNIDFYLYSSWDDLQNNVNRWETCNYDDPLIGFPRDCGPNGLVTSQWTSNISADSRTAIYAIYQPQSLSTSTNIVENSATKNSDNDKMIVILLSTTIVLSIGICCYITRRMINKPATLDSSNEFVGRSPSAPDIDLEDHNEHIELVFLPDRVNHRDSNQSQLEEELRQLVYQMKVANEKHKKELEIEKKKEEKYKRDLELAREKLDHDERGLHSEYDSMIKANAENVAHRALEASRAYDEFILERQHSQSARDHQINELADKINDMRLLIRRQDDEIKEQKTQLMQRQISNEGHRNTIHELKNESDKFKKQIQELEKNRFERECTICFENPYKRDPPLANDDHINQGYSMLIPCGHIYCSVCALEQRRRNGSCPECRKRITGINRVFV